MLSGFKTFIFGLLLAILPQSINYIAKFDFTHAFGLSPNSASVVGLIVIALRAMTTTPIFQSK